MKGHFFVLLLCFGSYFYLNNGGMGVDFFNIYGENFEWLNLFNV